MRKRIICLLLASVMVLGAGCGVTPQEPEPTEPSDATEAPVEKIKDIVLQAEDGTLYGNLKVLTNRDDCTGSGYVTGFNSQDSFVSIPVEVPQTGAYDLIFSAASGGDYKEMDIYVDGGKYGTIQIQSNDFAANVIKKSWLSAGKHTIEVKMGWGHIDLDRVTVRQVEPVQDSLYSGVDKEPCNPNATQTTKNLYHFLTSIYGKQTLMGSHTENNAMFCPDMIVVEKTVGTYPAFMEMDLMEFSSSRGGEEEDVDSFVRNAETFYEKGGIIATSWHWNAPAKYLYDTPDQPAYRGFYQEATSIDVERIMLGQDKEGYDLLLHDIDIIAQVLKKLQEKDIPVIFRPLHEGDGGWFWWGGKTGTAYKELWWMLYDRLTNYHGLNNLIWVWNCSDRTWYPGDNCVDIISVDTSAGYHNYATLSDHFVRQSSYGENRKMVAMSECGTAIDPDRMHEENVQWLYYSFWTGGFADSYSTEYKYDSNSNTEQKMLEKIAASAYILMLDDLPDWKNGIFEKEQ